MNTLTKTAVLAAITAPLLMATAANAGDCGAGDPGCLDDPSPSLEQVIVSEATAAAFRIAYAYKLKKCLAKYSGDPYLISRCDRYR